MMKIPAAAFMVTALVVSTPLEAAGCIKGALVGGVAGHYAHHHAVAGAIAGCAVGHHMAKKAAHKNAVAAHAPGATH